MPDAAAVPDLLVVGGGLGGVAAARAALTLGRTVVLTEAGDWLGGQLTSQGVPPDEHPWIEGEFVSAGYRELRERIRDHYRRNLPLTAQARQAADLNPGLGLVSGMCHEPRIGAAVLDGMLSEWVSSGRLTLLLGHRPVRVSRSGDRVTGVVVRDAAGRDRTLTGRFVVDATELGDLLELADVPHVVGAEAQAETGELHAADRADPLDQQAITWCAAVEYRPGEVHVIPEPPGYRHWRDHADPRWPGPQLSWTAVDPITLEPRRRPLFAGSPEQAAQRMDDDLWHFRRIVARTTFDETYAGNDVTLVNWPQVDYWELPILGVDRATRRRALRAARELTLSFVHWMQTEAPRTGGGRGYPELRLRGDVLGTQDGLAKEPYIREARRIRPLFTVTEAHIGQQMRGAEAGSELFPDTVGIGYYRIDLHPSTGGATYVDIDCFPFQVPLGALVPVGVTNLLPAAKNIGTTHVTNGAFRLHPVEWSIGEAVGALASQCLDRGLTPLQVRDDAGELRRYQGVLAGRLGVPLAWPDEIRRGAGLG